MNNILFSILAKLNKLILPSFTKRRLDLSKASKLQLLIFGWKLYVTKRALK
ncbi:SsrA-binding protein [Aquimarina gracilis]|uniref:SsrA-binding protein n=1 Tax=Aquimarina gracilis TaxID=874422 RepID=A0ABU5ZT13_9FLAO|nr:SsrA-binding protein [Aquimarina gracilis]MEB3344717.1 SsrA-binding protein [Aquimarina gracilis]